MPVLRGYRKNGYHTLKNWGLLRATVKSLRIQQNDMKTCALLLLGNTWQMSTNIFRVPIRRPWPSKARTLSSKDATSKVPSSVIYCSCRLVTTVGHKRDLYLTFKINIKPEIIKCIYIYKTSKLHYKWPTIEILYKSKNTIMLNNFIYNIKTLT